MKFCAALAALVLTGFAAEASGIGEDPGMLRYHQCGWECEWPDNVRGEPIVFHIDRKGFVRRSYKADPVTDTKIIRGPEVIDRTLYFDFSVRREGGPLLHSE